MTELLKIEKLGKSFGALEVLKGIDLTVEKGETVVILGSSGSGKSTLLRCVNFMEIPTSGRIAIAGKPVGTERNQADGRIQVDYRESELIGIRATVGMVFQHFNLFPHMTAFGNVMEGPRTVLKLPRGECEARAETYLSKVGLADKMHSYPAHLSGGQQQRVAIARALAMEPQLMLFDEATSALDPELVGEVLQTIRSLADEGMTMLIVTHELGFAYSVASKVLFLSDGVILEQGAPDDVLVRPKQQRTRDFLRGHATYKLPDLAIT